MVIIEQDTRPSSRDDGDATLPWEMTARRDKGVILPLMGALEKNMAYQHALAVWEVRLTKIPYGWRLMVKGNRGGDPVVCVEKRKTWLEAVDWLAYMAEGGQMTFFLDKWPVKGQLD